MGCSLGEGLGPGLQAEKVQRHPKSQTAGTPGPHPGGLGMGEGPDTDIDITVKLS